MCSTARQTRLQPWLRHSGAVWPTEEYSLNLGFIICEMSQQQLLPGLLGGSSEVKPASIAHNCSLTSGQQPSFPPSSNRSLLSSCNFPGTVPDVGRGGIPISTASKAQVEAAPVSTVWASFMKLVRGQRQRSPSCMQ